MDVSSSLSGQSLDLALRWLLRHRQRSHVTKAPEVRDTLAPCGRLHPRWLGHKMQNAVSIPAVQGSSFSQKLPLGRYSCPLE